MARRTKQEALETRSRILDIAEHVFHERGVSRTSLAEIAQAADLTRGAIYWHFRNKADLFEAMMARVTLPLEQTAQRAGDAALADPLGFVRECALDALRRTAADPQCQRVFEIVLHKCEFVDEMTQLKARQIECRAQCLEQMQRGLENAVARGQLPGTVNTRRAAIGLSALVDGLIADWLLDPSFHVLADDAAPIIDTYLAGLGARAAAGAPPAVPARRRSTRTPAPAATRARKRP